MNSLIKWRPQLPWSPFGPMWDMDFEDLFEDFEDLTEPSWMMEPWWRGREYSPRWAPRLETYHKDGNFVIKADLPGVNPKDIQVTMEGDRLIVQGERRMDKEIKRKDYRRREAFYGSFRRAIPIPKGLKPEKIKAKYRDGVLEITAPVDKSQLPKEIKVEVEKPAIDVKKTD